MRIACAVVFALAFAGVARAEPPTWDELAVQFGREKGSPEVARLVAAENLSETTKGPSGMFTPDDHAYTLLYNKNRIETIKLRVAPYNKEFSEPHWKPYAAKLPGGLTGDDGRDEVIEKLGPPIEGRKTTWKHQMLHIWVHFDEKEERINALYVSPAVIEAAP